jgi:hypothetical protein
VPVLLAVGAEAGHLTAALNSRRPRRALFHILVVAGLGLLAAILYCGHSRVEPTLGIVLNQAIP